MSHKGFKFIGVDFHVIEECVSNSFEEPGNMMSDNKLLKEDRRWQYLMGVNTHPSITINNQSYYGDFNGRDIARALCASFNVQKPECQQGELEQLKGDFEELEVLDTSVSGSHTFDIILLVIFTVLINIALIKFMRSQRKKKQKDEIQQQVNLAVAQYFALRGDEPPQSE